MRLRLRVLSLVALAALAGCGQRVRLNPFDPGNPVTGGRPAGFVALASNGVVTLRWSFVNASGLLGYQLFRRVTGDPAFSILGGLIAPTTTTTGDYGLQNGVDHSYRLYFVFDQGLGDLPAEDLATPGPLVAWVADFDHASAVHLTADGRHVLSEDPGYVGPTNVAADPGRGLVWVSDTDGGKVVIFSPSSGQHVSVASAATPAALALDPVDGSAWVCDAQRDAIFRFQTDGSAASPFQLTPISNPLDVAVDPVDRSLWVCERGADRVRHYTSSGSPAGFVDLMAPSRVAVDSVTRAAWVTSFTSGKLFLVSNVPALVDSFGGFQGPIGIAVDSRRGLVWVADAVANQVVALYRNNQPAFSVSTPGEPREIAIDPLTGNAWVTLAAAGQVALVSPTGAVIRRISGLGRPDGISLGVEP